MNRYALNITRLIKDRVSKVDPEAEVILYGSRARDDSKKNSDWDILILTDYPVSIEIERKFRDELYELELEISEVFSLQAYAKKDWNSRLSYTAFYHNVKQEGIIL